MSIAYQEAGDDSAGQENWGGSWRADGPGNHESVITHLEPDTEKAMAPHSSTLAWKIPWTEEPGGLPSMGSHRVRHN